MSTKELIDHIIAAEKMEDILDVANFKGAYNTLVMEVHPDKCSEVGADEAIRGECNTVHRRQRKA